MATALSGEVDRLWARRRRELNVVVDLCGCVHIALEPRHLVRDEISRHESWLQRRLAELGQQCGSLPLDVLEERLARLLGFERQEHRRSPHCRAASGIRAMHRRARPAANVSNGKLPVAATFRPSGFLQQKVVYLLRATSKNDCSEAGGRR